MSIFKYPPYQRTIPWRCDADYEMAVVSPVGIGPKGDPGNPLYYEDLTDEDKLDLGRKLIELGFQQGEKGEQGDAGIDGESAYEIAVRLGYEGTEEEWIESLTQYPALSDPDKEEMQGWVENYFGPEVIEEMVSDEIDEQADSIADQVSEGIYDRVYPIGSIYMSVNSTDPGTLFGGTWVRLTDTFLLAAGSTYAADDGTHTTATDGEAEVQLSESETPVRDHKHGFTRPTLSNTAHTHPLPNSAIISATGTNATTGYASIAASSAGAKAISHGNRTAVSALSGKTWDKSARQTGARSATTQISGGSVDNRTYISPDSSSSVEAHNNMPPYLAVYMWKRTA